jgi:hypothetical protein
MTRQLEAVAWQIAPNEVLADHRHVVSIGYFLSRLKPNILLKGVCPYPFSIPRLGIGFAPQLARIEVLRR